MVKGLVTRVLVESVRIQDVLSMRNRQIVIRVVILGSAVLLHEVQHFGLGVAALHVAVGLELVDELSPTLCIDGIAESCSGRSYAGKACTVADHVQIFLSLGCLVAVIISLSQHQGYISITENDIVAAVIS